MKIWPNNYGHIAKMLSLEKIREVKTKKSISNKNEIDFFVFINLLE